MIDFLFFTPHEKKNLYIYTSEKMDRPQNWLEMIGWKAFWLKKFERNRCGESFLTPTVTLGHVFKKKKTNTQNTFIVTFCC